MLGIYTKITGNSGGNNEYLQIEKVYDEMVHEKNMMHKKIVDVEQAMQGYYLFSLMKGCTIQTEGDKLPIKLLPEEKIVLVGLYIPAPENDDNAQGELLFFVVDNIFSELMEKENFYRLNEGRFLFYLFRVLEDVRWKDICLEKLRFLSVFLEEKLGQQSIVAAVSRQESSVECLREQQPVNQHIWRLTHVR